MNFGNQIRCVNSLCNAVLKSTQEGFTICPKCNTSFIMICHEYPIVYHKNLKCTKCNNRNYYFNCDKCSYLIVLSNHRIGTNTFCVVCGDNAIYLTCGVCFKSFKSDYKNNQEGRNIKCKKCQGNFVYLTCQTCLQPIYSQKIFKIGQKVQCKNMKCRSELIAKLCEKCNALYAGISTSNNPHFCYQQSKMQQAMIPISLKTSIQPKGVKIPTITKSKVDTVKISSFQKQRQKPNQTVEQNICKICLYKPIVSINTTCFHLIVCQDCVPKDGKCPLCRQIGQYKKVYI